MKNKSVPEEVLIKLFGSVSRGRILTLLIGQPHREFYQREIMYEIGFPLQPVQRELQNLVDLGIIKRKETHNRVYYEINTACPLYKPLRQICTPIEIETK